MDDIYNKCKNSSLVNEKVWRCPQCKQTYTYSEKFKDYRPKCVFCDVECDLEEMTTSADIAFAPQMGFREPTKAELAAIGLGKRRKDESYLKLLEQDMNAKVVKLKDEIIRKIEDAIADRDIGIMTFVRVFREYGKAPVTMRRVAIDYSAYDASIEKLKGALPDDVGELELISSAITARRQLSGYEPFDKYNYLYGAKVSTSVEGTKLIYEGYIDMSYNVSETIFVSDPDKVDKIDDEIESVKSVKNVVFPVGGKFRRRFFDDLKTILLEDEE